MQRQVTSKLAQGNTLLQQVPSIPQNEEQVDEPKDQEVDITQTQVYGGHQETMDVDKQDEQVVLTPQD